MTVCVQVGKRYVTLVVHERPPRHRRQYLALLVSGDGGFVSFGGIVSFDSRLVSLHGNVTIYRGSLDLSHRSNLALFFYASLDLLDNRRAHAYLVIPLPQPHPCA